MTPSPLTPPPELVEDWIELAKPLPKRPPNPGELATLAAQWGYSQSVKDLEAMLYQAMQAAETLRDCWLERTKLTIEDDPFVEDACSTIRSIRSELLRPEP
jgi:hypothetical protein